MNSNTLPMAARASALALIIATLAACLGSYLRSIATSNRPQCDFTAACAALPQHEKLADLQQHTAAALEDSLSHNRPTVFRQALRQVRAVSRWTDAYLLQHGALGVIDVEPLVQYIRRGSNLRTSQSLCCPAPCLPPPSALTSPTLEPLCGKISARRSGSEGAWAARHRDHATGRIRTRLHGA